MGTRQGVKLVVLPHALAEMPGVSGHVATKWELVGTKLQHALGPGGRQVNTVLRGLIPMISRIHREVEVFHRLGGHRLGWLLVASAHAH